MSTIGFAQEEGKKNPTYVIINYVQSDMHKKLIVSLSAKIEGERGRKKLAGEEIEFYTVSNKSNIFLGRAKTNAEGAAVLELDPSQQLLANEEGEIEFGANYNCNIEYDVATKSITVKPIDLVVSFTEIDSVKNIVVSAFQKQSDGVEIPVEEDVVFYVPRQFSMLKIGKTELREGEGLIEFPVTLPGDSIGNLKIIARIEESKKFGTVETIAIKDWGQPRPPVVVEKRRGLGDTDAPLWMVYTLIVLLSAVWFHYFYLLYVLYSIKHKSNKHSPA
jgi:hypothetical protein